VDAQFSIPYTLSTALLKGDVFLEDFETDRIMASKARSLAESVKIFADPDLPEKDIVHSSVAVSTRDGQIHKAVVNAPLGNPANSLDMAKCREKFLKCLAYSGIEFDEGRSNELLSVVESLEQVGDVGIITSLMQA
jgi:2-methylcitrate dehydratase PrpD